MGTTNRQIVLARRPEGRVTADCFEDRVGEVPELVPGKALLRTLYVSIDPAIRGWISPRGSGYLPPVGIGEPVRSNGVGVVVESLNDDLPVGSVVTALTGWQEYSLVGSDWAEPFTVGTIAPAGASAIDALTTVGQQGMTAYAAVTAVLKPKPGDNFVVSAAGSSVGSMAGQLAKMAGARVVGIAGTDAKCTWVTDELGFDACINYRTENVVDRLKEECPGGVNIFFDNVGGELLDDVLRRIAPEAKVLLCGSLSTDDGDAHYRLRNYPRLMSRRATMMGFNTIDHWGLYDEAAKNILQWIESGEIVTNFELSEGLEQAPELLVRLFAGDHLGKLVIKVADA